MLRSSRVLVAATMALPLGAACKSTPTKATGPVDANFGDATLIDANVGDSKPNRDATSMVPFDARAGRDSAIPDVNRGEAPTPPKTDFCALPGAVVWSDGLPTVVPGGASGSPDLTWMKLPDGFCSHYFATVPEARQLRVSPSGDLFVASPGRPAAGGAPAGLSNIFVLPDDDQDGVAESPVTVFPSQKLVTTQGMLFYGGYFYYQNGTSIFKTPWTSGQRVATSVGAQVLDVTVYVSDDHWAKVLDADDNGNIYVTNGGDEGIVCAGAEVTTMPPFQGGILQIVDGMPNGQYIARGLRNAYALRCAKGTGMCFGLELSRDFVPELGSREKLFPVRAGDNWGFPCCATANTPYSDYTDPVPNCSAVSAEEDSFVIDHTPFGLDFEEGFWSGTWKYRAFVALHGYFESWYGARVLAIATDPRTGWPEVAQETDAGTATMMDFATGWDDDKQDHGRPAAITFGPDGRMYLGDDMEGLIVWIAPVSSGS